MLEASGPPLSLTLSLSRCVCVCACACLIVFVHLLLHICELSLLFPSLLRKLFRILPVAFLHAGAMAA